MRHRIHALPLSGDFHEVSATEVRRRLASGEDWEHLVPAAVVPLARRDLWPRIAALGCLADERSATLGSVAVSKSAASVSQLLVE